MPNQFLSDEFGDIEDYFVTDYWLIDNFVGDTLWGWGISNAGRLGEGTSGNSQRDVPVTTFAGGTNWKQVMMDKGSSGAAIKTDGTLWVWGWNREGELGINEIARDPFPTGLRPTPVTTFAGGNNWKSVAGGYFYTSAIKTDGSLWVWGLNSSGQLGINNTITRSTPVTTFSGGTNWKQISCGGYHTAAVKTDGTLWTWGGNGNIQLGNSTTVARIVPGETTAGGTNWKSVACGRFHTAAIKTDGTLWVWGRNNDGQIGINNYSTPQGVPVTTFAGGNNWKQVAGGRDHTAAIKTDGSLWTWGLNSSGQLGINNTAGRNTPVTTFAGGTDWKQVACGDNHTAAIKTDGTLWGWGANGGRNLGLGNNDNVNRSTPVTTFAGGNNWKQLFSSVSSTMAIKSGLNVDLS